MNTLQKHGVYLIAIGTLMARHSKSASIINMGSYTTELEKLMVARGCTVEEARDQIFNNDPNSAVNAQF